MPYYRRTGEVPPKRHTRFRTPDGALYAEELMSQHGFSGASSLLYHLRPPTGLVAAATEPVRADRGGEATPNHPLLPYHFRTDDRATDPVDLATGRTPLLANRDVCISVARHGGPGELYRNAVGDEIVYLREGRLRLESTFGVLDCETGDYVVIPTATTHRWVPRDPADPPARVLIVEAAGHVGPPDRYLSPRGQFLEHSPFCERDIHAPVEPLTVEADQTDVLVRQAGGLTRYTYAGHPFDVVGWDGCVYPFRFSIHDFEPVTGRIHQPPPVHQTFAGPGFVVCSFVPRKLDYHPAAVPAPYNHANVDSDEVIYYCDGDFTSRQGAGIAPGSMTLHPAGHVHGPQPGSVEASLDREATDELAVMIDTFRPLALTDAARACADPDYPWSWSRSDVGRGVS